MHDEASPETSQKKKPQFESKFKKRGIVTGYSHTSQAYLQMSHSEAINDTEQFEEHKALREAYSAPEVDVNGDEIDVEMDEEGDIMVSGNNQALNWKIPPNPEQE